MIVRPAACLAVLMTAPAAMAQNHQDNGEIVVTAPEIDLAKRAVSIFVQPPHGEQIARWREPLRLQVYYAPPDAANYLRTRIGAIADTVGLKVVPAGRQPNVAIVFTGASSEFTRRLLKAHPALYRDTNRTNFPRKAEVAALLADRPVRWFEVRVDGAGDGSGDFSATQRNMSYGAASRITAPTLFRKYMSYVIIDADLVKSVNWQQLADYLAMVVLTEPGLDDGHVGENTILSIFSPANPARPAELTALDKTILKAYYDYTETLRFPAQRAEIERSVAKTLKQQQ